MRASSTLKAAVSSGAASATQVGVLDAGFLTLTETADEVRRICAATAIPVIADGEAGYGNALHVRRAVRELELAGAAAITLVPSPHWVVQVER